MKITKELVEEFLDSVVDGLMIEGNFDLKIREYDCFAVSLAQAYLELLKRKYVVNK